MTLVINITESEIKELIAKKIKDSFINFKDYGTQEIINLIRLEIDEYDKYSATLELK